LINRLVIENLKHRPIRTLLTVIAIGVQVTMILTLVGLSEGTIRGLADRTRGIGADIIIRPAGSAVIGMSGAPMSAKLAPAVAKRPHVSIATGTMEHALQMFLRITGIDFPEFERMSGGFRYLKGRAPAATNELVVDEWYARQNNLSAGDTVKLVQHDWKVAGIVESGKLGRIFVDIATLQDLTSNTGKISVIYVKVDDPKNIQAVLADLKQWLPENPIFTTEEFISQISVDSVPLLKQFTNVTIGLSVVFGFLVVFLAMYTAVLERTREIGILKALGASPGYILRILIRETVMIALLGSLLGILLTYGTKAIILATVGATLQQVIVPQWWPIATALAVAGAAIGAIYPGLKAAKQDAIEALTYE
jgi:putative ABC transport system permease protein